ncbi:MAG: hypothetical protein H6757_01390 [Candidatus Omnitrophica bacterium]|nr:hypothetical protein [Candidatus Omnitrophota bacterium]
MTETHERHENSDEGPKILASKPLQASAEIEKKKRTQMIVLAVLLLFLFYMLWTTFFSKPAKHHPVQQQTESVQTGDLPAVNDLGTLLDESVFQQKTSSESETSADEDYWSKSPFSIAAEEQEEAVVKQHFHLQGTVLGSGGDEYAVLNEKIVKRGDRIADNTVKEIRHNSVILETDGGETIVVNGE